MILAVLALSALFENHIYTVSSLFIGFIAGSIPLIVKEEKESLREVKKGMFFFILGTAAVVWIVWLNGHTAASAMDLSQFSVGLGIRLFFTGMIAISAMFLTGISGSTLLLIFGAYMPMITAVRGFLGFEFSYVPCLMFFGCGVLTGAATVVRGIKVCLERFRPRSVYAILGMMLGSFYAIVLGPTTLQVPQAALSLGNFSVAACLAGAGLVVGMQMLREREEKYGN